MSGRCPSPCEARGSLMATGPTTKRVPFITEFLISTRLRSSLPSKRLRASGVVRADGKFVTASERENEDLFWGLRGGGGNFGVVTSLEYRLHEVDQVFAGPIFYNLEDADSLFRMFDEFIRDAPEQFGGFPAFQIAPPLPFIPENRHADTLALAAVHWSGPLEKAQKVLKPFIDVAPIVANGTGPLP